MTSSGLQARRATVEDLPQMGALWHLEHLPVDELEKRFTEFQVVVSNTGEVLATIGVQLAGNEGLLHGEAIARPEHADDYRELLFERVLMVCRNHAVDRLWTRLSLPYWRARGFSAVTGEELAGLPEAFGDAGAKWHVLKLKSAEATGEAIEKQFVMLKAMHHAEIERMQRRAKMLRGLALTLIVIVSALTILWAVVLIRYGPRFLNRGP